MSVEQNGSNIGPNGGKINFSLPVYGDFFVDFLFNSHWSGISANEGNLPDLPMGYNLKPGDAPLPLTFTAASTATSPTFVVDGETRSLWNAAPTERYYYNVEYRYWDSMTSKYVDHDTAASTATIKKFTTKYQDFVRWCDFPGEKISNYTEFTVNGNQLDSYTNDVYIFNRQYFIPEDKKQCYYDLVGQQWPKKMHCPSDGSK